MALGRDRGHHARRRRDRLRLFPLREKASRSKCHGGLMASRATVMMVPCRPHNTRPPAASSSPSLPRTLSTSEEGAIIGGSQAVVDSSWTGTCLVVAALTSPRQQPPPSPKKKA